MGLSFSFRAIEGPLVLLEQLLAHVLREGARGEAGWLHLADELRQGLEDHLILGRLTEDGP